MSNSSGTNAPFKPEHIPIIRRKRTVNSQFFEMNMDTGNPDLPINPVIEIHPGGEGYEENVAALFDTYVVNIPEETAIIIQDAIRRYDAETESSYSATVIAEKKDPKSSEETSYIFCFDFPFGEWLYQNYNIVSADPRAPFTFPYDPLKPNLPVNGANANELRKVLNTSKPENWYQQEKQPNYPGLGAVSREKLKFMEKKLFSLWEPELRASYIHRPISPALLHEITHSTQYSYRYEGAISDLFLLYLYPLKKLAARLLLRRELVSGEIQIAKGTREKINSVTGLFRQLLALFEAEALIRELLPQIYEEGEKINSKKFIASLVPLFYSFKTNTEERTQHFEQEYLLIKSDGQKGMYPKEHNWAALILLTKGKILSHFPERPFNLDLLGKTQQDATKAVVALIETYLENPDHYFDDVNPDTLRSEVQRAFRDTAAHLCQKVEDILPLLQQSDIPPGFLPYLPHINTEGRTPQDLKEKFSLQPKKS